VTLGVVDGTAGFHGVSDHRRKLDPLLAKFELALHDPGQVKQVIDQSDHLPHLTRHDVACPPNRLQIEALMKNEISNYLDQRDRIFSFLGSLAKGYSES
jgi:hypothetical protein